MKGFIHRARLAVFVTTLAGGMAIGILHGYASADQPSAQDSYMDKCAVCHARDGSGRTVKGRKDKVKDVRQTIKKMSEAQMIEEVEKGKGAYMDSWSDKFSKAQIKALVDYYRTLASQPGQ